MIDHIIRHQIYLQRYSNGLYKQIEPQLKEMRDRINARILNATPYQLERLSLLLKDINEIIATQEVVKPTLWQELADYENEFAINTLSATTTAAIGTGLNDAALTAIITKDKVKLANSKAMAIPQLIEVFNDRYASDIKSELELGIAMGETTDALAKRITTLSDTRTPQQARALINTVSNYVGNKTRNDVFSKYDKLYEGKRYTSVLDSHTSAICMSLSGNIYDINDSKAPSLPKHYNCRSVYTYELKDEYKILKGGEETQSSETGYVPASWNYNDWLKRQPAKVIDEILGKERGLAFRKNKLPISRFIDSTGNFYTLDELKKKDLIK